MWENTQSDFHKLWATANDNACEIDRADGSVEINGVVLPRIVANELHRLGVPLSSYSAAQLQAAIQACAVDETLIDDPDGDNFLDMLNMTDAEEEKESESVFASFRLPAKEWHSHNFEHGLGKDEWSFFGRERDENTERGAA